MHAAPCQQMHVQMEHRLPTMFVAIDHDPIAVLVLSDQLFAFLSRNSRTATAFFGLPPNRVVEMGAQIEL